MTIPATWSMVTLHDRTATVPRGVVLDLGATAKAVAADRCAQRVHTATGSGVLINLGGDIATAGTAPAGGWQVLVHDDDGDPACSIALPAGGRAGHVEHSASAMASRRRGLSITSSTRGPAGRQIRCGAPSASPRKPVSPPTPSAPRRSCAAGGHWNGLRRLACPPGSWTRDMVVHTVGGWPTADRRAADDRRGTCGPSAAAAGSPRLRS